MMPLALILLHELLCIVLVCSVFARGRQMTHYVRRDIRAVFSVLFLAAMVGIVAPLALAWSPDWWSLLLLVAIVAVQLVTSAHWVCGVPHQFYRPGCIPCCTPTQEPHHEHHHV